MIMSGSLWLLKDGSKEFGSEIQTSVRSEQCQFPRRD